MDRNAGTPLVALGRRLATAGYRFVTVTPATHRRVLARDRRPARDLRDVFGWSRPFEEAIVGAEILRLLRDADAVEETREGFRSRVRFSSLDGGLFVHSAYPTGGADAVFFGPDTYRFCAAIERAAAVRAARWTRVLDVGCGSGAGGIIAAAHAERVILGDVNDVALAFARVNAELASVRAEIIESDVAGGVDGSFDLIVANPPYMRDPDGRVYRDGGGDLGEGLSQRIVEECLGRLSSGGTLLLYTGAPIVDGRDVFYESTRAALGAFAGKYTYEEVDPDVFGEELDEPAYAAVERIAAVVLTATRS